ncbi:MAG: glycosyltransferase 61 family protein [Alphaproteobacteria bacterium]|nr:glycosyltransferase 61 family protein [Alphaproteobacteria bacterium]
MLELFISWRKRAYARTKAGDVAGATASLRRILVAEPRDRPAIMHMAEVLHVFSKTATSVDFLMRAAILQVDVQVLDLLISGIRGADGDFKRHENFFTALLTQGRVKRAWALSALRLAVYQHDDVRKDAATLLKAARHYAPVADARFVRSVPAPVDETTSLGVYRDAIIAHDHAFLRLIVGDQSLLPHDRVSDTTAPYLAFAGEPESTFERAYLGGYARNYFHWLIEASITLKIYLEAGLTLPILSLGPRSTPFQVAFLDLFGLSDRVHPCITRPCRIHVRELTISRHVFNSAQIEPEHISWLRDRFAGLLAERGLQPGPERVYVARNDSTMKRIVDEDRIIELLKQRSFSIVTPGEHGLLEQARLFADAKVIVGVHGAGLTNMAFSPSNARIIELDNTRNYPSDHYVRLAKAAGHDHRYLRAQPSDDGGNEAMDRDTPRPFDLQALCRLLDET